MNATFLMAQSKSALPLSLPIIASSKKEKDPFYRTESELAGRSFDGPFYYPYQRKIKSKGRVDKKIFDKEGKHGHEDTRRRRRRLLV